LNRSEQFIKGKFIWHEMGSLPGAFLAGAFFAAGFFGLGFFSDSSSPSASPPLASPLPPLILVQTLRKDVLAFLAYLIPTF
jgi:hypothetical protein